MKKPRDVLLVLLLFFMTVAYSWFIQLAMTAFNILLAKWELTALPIFSVVTASAPLPWQLMAFASLLVNLTIVFFQSRKKTVSCSLTTAAALQTVWIFTCLMVHGIGFFLPFIAPKYIIK
ncbi:MAG: hypothetical protein KQI81_22920 [Deltaproteobacteria bacterium]|nr:hypothetical protein [Deltaproteobacteria bacterium]